LGWPLGESDNYETVAGWLIDMADTIPQVGDSYDFNGYRFTVQSMRRRRIQVIRVERLDDDDARTSDDEGDDRDD
jgi:putative hemolysin